MQCNRFIRPSTSQPTNRGASPSTKHNSKAARLKAKADSHAPSKQAAAQADAGQRRVVTGRMRGAWTFERSLHAALLGSRDDTYCTPYESEER
ncbi:uncharacterized protein TRIREDRAFT_102887 [Trichoderma reesei QM6a]|uniref:Predicted protein n=2 Tax=Hypocrea jecorina TaxID=51453 RepID=G0R8J8_HYPJQ|nr:uncharacterized protein TRIREDRAFT_102887 [Trichoderma reesei QM6a]EGR52361.1 predicted protein [Trichoderma reesei QM6a]ETS06701.1 hypothetical protein M419DRAFT_126133 [Trichoderma reesei RUT C-30]